MGIFFRGEREQKKFAILLMFGLFLLFAFVYLFAQNKAQAATAPSIITYQGKLLISSHLATTTQSMFFVLYDAATAGNILYTASGTIGSPLPVSTTPSQGLFSINLGDTGTNSLAPTIFQNNGSVYLEVRVGADTLTPRKQITASPYALNSRYLDGVGVNTNSTTQYIPMSDVNGNFTFNSTTVSTSTITRLNVLGSASVGTTTTSSTFTVQGVAGSNPIFEVASSTGASVLRILANGNVGINSSTPTRTLSIVGDLMATGYLFDSTNSSGTTGMVLQTNDTGYAWVSTSSLGISAGGAFINLQSITSGTQQTGHLNISGTGIFGTSVGIGTSTVSSTLTIQGISGLNPFSIVSSSGSNLVTVLQNGNVGIGTTTPSEKLQVVGNISNIITAGTSISQLATVNLSVGSAPEQVVVSGKYAYTSNYASGDISVVDISNPLFPVQLSTTSIDFGNNPSGIFISGRYLYVTGDSTGNFTVIDVSNPVHPFVVTSTALGIGKPLFVSGHYAYTSISQSFFVILDISNPLSPQLVSSVRLNNVDSLIRSIYVSGNYAYAANWNGGALNEVDVIDISNPKNPIQIASTTVDAQPNSIFVSGRYAYTANAAGTISIINIANPASPLQIANPTLPGVDPKAIFVSGRYAYVAGGSTNNISIVDISSSTNPYMVTTVAVGSDAKGIFVSGRYAYVVNNGSNNMSIVDISGTEVSSLIAHSAEVGNLQSRNDIFAQGNIMAGTSLMVGAGGIMSQGSLSVFASSTVSSSIFSLASAQRINILNVLANGNIGINSSTPFASLALQGTVGTNPLRIVSSTGAALFTILQNGYVGIGTSAPGQQLTIVASSTGTGTTTVAIRMINPGLFAQDNVALEFAPAAGTISSLAKIVGIAPGSSHAELGFFTSNGGAAPVEHIRITGPGRVGIGIALPTEKLQVVGNIANITTVSTTISQIATTSVGASPRSIFVSGRYAYIANYTSGTISVVDISIPSAPTQLATASVGAGPYSIFVSGRYAYTANFSQSNISVVDISNPSAPIQISTASVGTGARSIYVSGRYAYVANYTSNDISVVDISNPSAPVQISTTSVGTNPSSIFVFGRYAYVTNQTTNDISVVDISNPSAPIQIATTSVGNGPFSIYVSGRYAYVANISGNKISVVDISIPSAPIETSTLTIAGGSAPTGIFVSGRYAYVTNQTTNIVSVVDIANPSVPTQVASTSVGITPYSIYVSGRYAYVTNRDSNSISVVDISGTEVSSLIAHSAEVGNLQSRNDIFAQGNIIAGTGLMVGSGGIMSQGSLSVFASSTGSTSSIFDISSAQISNLLKVFANGNVGIGTSTSLAKLSVVGTAGNYPAFDVASSTNISMFHVMANGNVGINTTSPPEKLSVIGNISNITTAGTRVSQVATTSVGGQPLSIFVSGKYAYTANYASGTISIIDISNPSAPVQVSSTAVGSAPYAIFVSGRYAYVGEIGTNKLFVVDISNPSAPVQVSSIAVSGPRAVYVSGRYAYVALSGGVVSIIDISNPQSLTLVNSVTVGANPGSIYVSGHYAYVANNGAGGLGNTISVLDISNPSAPVQIATTTVGVGPISIYVSGRYAYTANSVSNTISVVDISNPYAPIQIASTSVQQSPQSVYVSGRYAYVTNANQSSMSVVDISSSTMPYQITTVAVGIYPDSVYVSGRYAYVANRDSNSISVIDISGTEVSSIIAHSAEVGNIQSRNDIFAQGNIMAGTSLMVGSGGIMSQGSLSIFASSTASSSVFSIASAVTSSIFKVFANGFVGIGTGTQTVTSTLDVQGQVEVNLSSPTDATSALCHTTNGAVANQVIYDCNTTVNPDYMEMYAADVGLQRGDVVALSGTFVTTTDGNVIPKLSKSASIYQTGLIGVISDASQISDFNTIGHNVLDSDNPLPLALSGRIPIKVTDINGDIHVGDKLTSSNIPGVAMKATEEGATIAIAMGDYISSEIGTVMGFVNISWNNKIYRALTVDTTSSTLTIGSSDNPYNLIVSGNISMSNTGAVNKLSFATSTLFESSIASFAGARAFILNASNFASTSADNYIISLRSNNDSVFSVAANGDVHAKGNYYGASAVLGTSTNPGDLAERVDIAIDDIAEPGDVMIIDQNAPDTYRRSGLAYEQSVAGIISSNPTIVVGNGKTNYTAVIAMVGRVPVKVSNENGNIARGDLLITASTTGFAMKYDPAKDNNNKMVAVIGVALESLTTSSGKVLTLIRTGWIYNRDQAITNIKDDIQQMAAAQGINLSSTGEASNLNIQDTSGQLSYIGGTLDLQNNSLINVTGIIGRDNKWRIDEFGNLIQKIATANGDKETYSLQSSGKQEMVISGTSTLVNGTIKVILGDLDQAIIDKTVPLKISITMSGETKGVYVSERNFDSFVVKENENGQSNASFDWTVIAKILPPDLTTTNTGSETIVDTGFVTSTDAISTTPDVILSADISSSTGDVTTTADISSSTLATP